MAEVQHRCVLVERVSTYLPEWCSPSSAVSLKSFYITNPSSAALLKIRASYRGVKPCLFPILQLQLQLLS